MIKEWMNEIDDMLDEVQEGFERNEKPEKKMIRQLAEFNWNE